MMGLSTGGRQESLAGGDSTGVLEGHDLAEALDVLSCRSPKAIPVIGYSPACGFGSSVEVLLSPFRDPRL